MKKDTRYICEYCGTAFETESECAECEGKHVVPKNIKVMFSKGSSCAHHIIVLYEDGTKDDFVCV